VHSLRLCEVLGITEKEDFLKIMIDQSKVVIHTGLEKRISIYLAFSIPLEKQLSLSLQV